METIIYLLAAITGATLVISIVLLLKIKNINYLLEQPIVKKMSPQLKLKPVKVDDAEEENKKNQHRNHQNQNQNSNPNRNNRPMTDKPAEGNGEPRRDFNNRNDRTPRNERPEGGERPRNNNDRFRDRNRDGRDNRDTRQDRNRNQRLDVFTNEKENHPEENVNAHKPAMQAAPAQETAPQNQQHISPLPARRPLPSAISRDEETKPSFASAPAEDAVMVGQDDSDIQHGRRNQLKKKPVFADVKLEEAEVKTAEGANA